MYMKKALQCIKKALQCIKKALQCIKKALQQVPGVPKLVSFVYQVSLGTPPYFFQFFFWFVVRIIPERGLMIHPSEGTAPPLKVWYGSLP